MISKITAPNSVPTNISDYVAQNAHMMAFMNQVNMQAFILTDPIGLSKPKIALGSYVSHGGSLYKVDSDDEDITGSPADGKVYVRVTGDATLTASFVTDISSYSYNHAYGSLTSGAYTLLPYELRKEGSDWLKYRFDMTKGTTDQDLRTVDGVGFSEINVSGFSVKKIGVDPFVVTQPAGVADTSSVNNAITSRGLRPRSYFRASVPDMTFTVSAGGNHTTFNGKDVAFILNNGDAGLTFYDKDGAFLGWVNINELGIIATISPAVEITITPEVAELHLSKELVGWSNVEDGVYVDDNGFLKIKRD